MARGGSDGVGGGSHGCGEDGAWGEVACVLLCCGELYCTVLCYSILYCTVVICVILYCGLECYTLLQHNAVR